MSARRAEVRQRLEAMDARAEKAERTFEEALAVQGPESSQVKELYAEYLRLKNQAELEERIAMQLYNMDVKDSTVATYRKINEAAAKVAQANGWDIVLLDTREIAIDDPRDPDPRSLPNRISRRGILFASPRVDITGDVIIYMNNEFNR
jgi:Skp family chaperone for outer membrane proteins